MFSKDDDIGQTAHAPYERRDEVELARYGLIALPCWEVTKFEPRNFLFVCGKS